MPDEIELATPENDVRGAMVTPPAFISDSIKRHVDAVLAEIPEGKNGAVVAVATMDGVNFAVAHRNAAKTWEVTVWAGKEWRGGVTAGAQVKHMW